MTLEERIELHEQWLQAMESNHERFAADLAAIDRRLDQASQIIVSLGQTQAVLFTAMASLNSNLDRLTGEVRELRAILDQYIRFRGDGQQKN